MKYKISIIIPIYNNEKYLDKTLSSLFKQSIGIDNLEIIMVNDCSSDGSAAIIKKYSDKYENFIDITLNKNSGLPGKPRNIGMDNATSDFVMFMDHDDFYADDACEVLFNRITTEDADIVSCNFNYVFDDGSLSKYISIIKDKKEIKIDAIDEDKRILALPPAIWTKIFRKSFLIKNNIRFPEGILAEDLSFYIHSLLNAKGIIYLNDYYGYNYRIRDSNNEKSTIHIRNKKYLNSMLSGYKYTLDILKKENKESYFPIIFPSHLKYWMICLATGETSESEKKELFEDAQFLFEKQDNFDFEVDKSYVALFEKIKNKDYNSAVLISDMISIFRKKEIRVNKNYRRLIKTNKKLEKQLKSKKIELAKIQPIKGYLVYKTGNISNRLKKRLKSN